MSKEEIIIQELKKSGYRITKQRRILLNVILSEPCGSCKEIYYKASSLDPSIGTATVYRMINTLEEIGAINRENMYKINCGKTADSQTAYVIEFDDDTSLRLSSQKWKQILQSGLEACGYSGKKEIRKVVAGM